MIVLKPKPLSFPFTDNYDPGSVVALSTLPECKRGSKRRSILDTLLRSLRELRLVSFLRSRVPTTHGPRGDQSRSLVSGTTSTFLVPRHRELTCRGHARCTTPLRLRNPSLKPFENFDPFDYVNFINFPLNSVSSSQTPLSSTGGERTESGGRNTEKRGRSGTRSRRRLFERNSFGSRRNETDRNLVI